MKLFTRTVPLTFSTSSSPQAAVSTSVWEVVASEEIDWQVGSGWQVGGGWQVGAEVTGWEEDGKACEVATKDGISEPAWEEDGATETKDAGATGTTCVES